ncbi:MAG: hypothetical protein ACK5IJ_05225 [Mangrovibacterium sp.]
MTDIRKMTKNAQRSMFKNIKSCETCHHVIIPNGNLPPHTKKKRAGLSCATCCGFSNLSAMHALIDSSAFKKKRRRMKQGLGLLNSFFCQNGI